MSDSTPESGSGSRKAGAFDIRNIIGALMGLYGVILVLAGLLGEHEPDDDPTRPGPRRKRPPVT